MGVFLASGCHEPRQSETLPCHLQPVTSLWVPSSHVHARGGGRRRSLCLHVYIRKVRPWPPLCGLHPHPGLTRPAACLSLCLSQHATSSLRQCPPLGEPLHCLQGALPSHTAQSALAPAIIHMALVSLGTRRSWSRLEELQLAGCPLCTEGPCLCRLRGDSLACDLPADSPSSEPSPQRSAFSAGGGPRPQAVGAPIHSWARLASRSTAMVSTGVRSWTLSEGLSLPPS